MREQIPLTRNARQVPGFNRSFFIGFGIQLLVFELHDLLVLNGLAHLSESLRIRQISVEMSKRDGGVQVLPTDTNFCPGTIGRNLKFLERGAERLFKGSAFVGFQRFLRYEDGDQLGFRQLEKRKVGHRLGETVTSLRKIELDQQAELVAHVIQVPLDRFGGDFDRER
jgi:hypothetical protein